MKKGKKILAFFVCVCLCMNLIVPSYASNENNALGVTFHAVLDTPTIYASNEDQTVVMRVNASEGVSLEGIGATVVCDEALSIASITNDDPRIDFTGSVDTNSGEIVWDGTADLELLSGVTNVAVVTFTVPAYTPAGIYEVGVEGIELTTNYGDIWESTASASAMLKIEDRESGYTTGLSSLTKEVSVEDTVLVNVAISHSSDTAFAAGEVVLNYDERFMTFNKEASSFGTATVKDREGKLTLEDYGSDKNFGTGVYVFAFDAIKDGQTTVTLVSAAFADKEDAVKSDLIASALSSAELAVTINKKVYKVTLPDIFVGESTIIDGEDYTFSLADGDNYDYHSIEATVNGTDAVVIDNGNGTYTVKNVTGVLVVTGNRTEKVYGVTFAGNGSEDITDGAAQATYDKDYTFTMPVAEGWAYSLESITIGGKSYTGYSVANSVYTIPGTAITGNIIITVNKEATIANVVVEGTGAGAAFGYEAKVDIGKDYTLTIKPEAGYVYTVTATMNGLAVDVIDNGDGTYTVKNVVGDIVFLVERAVIVDGVSVSEYLTLDGTKMWLIKNDTTLADGKVPTYDGENMFWSEEYDTYCYLVIANTLNTEDAAAMVEITDGTAVEVEYNMDVNITGKIDASDAQLIYNIYNAFYSEITTDMTMEKYLRADVNIDGKINVEDAVAVIAKILA